MMCSFSVLTNILRARYNNFPLWYFAFNLIMKLGPDGMMSLGAIWELLSKCQALMRVLAMRSIEDMKSVNIVLWVDYVQ